MDGLRLRSCFEEGGVVRGPGGLGEKGCGGGVVLGSLHDCDVKRIGVGEERLVVECGGRCICGGGKCMRYGGRTMPE